MSHYPMPLHFFIFLGDQSLVPADFTLNFRYVIKFLKSKPFLTINRFFWHLGKIHFFHYVIP